MNVFLKMQQLSFMVVEHDRVDPAGVLKNIFIELSNFKNSAFIVIVVIFYDACDVVQEQARGYTCSVG